MAIHEKFERRKKWTLSADGRRLSFAGCRLGSDWKKTLRQAAKEFPHLSTLDFDSSDFSDEHLFEFVGLVERGNFQFLETIKFVYTKLTNQGVIRFFQSVLNSHFRLLRSLHLLTTYDRPWNFDFLAEMEGKLSLEDFTISGDDSNLQCFSRCVESGIFDQLRVLSIASEQESTLAFISLFNLIKDGELPRLSKFHIRHHNIDDELSHEIKDCIHSGKLKRLSDLKVQTSNLTQVGLDALVDGIASGNLPILESLHLPAISPSSHDGLVSLAIAAKRGRLRNLKKLNIDVKYIPDDYRREPQNDFIIEFSKAIKANCIPNLEMLSLSQLRVGNSSVLRLLEAIKLSKQKNLRYLYLSGIPVDNQIVKEFQAAAEAGCFQNMENLSLRFSNSSSRGVNRILHMIKDGYLKKLQHLNFGGHQEFCDSQCELISKAARNGHLSQLQHMEFDAVGVTIPGFSKITSAAAEGTLRSLRIFSSTNSKMGNLELRALNLAAKNGNLPDLEDLNLSFTQIDDSWLIEFAEAAKDDKWSNLERLNLACTSVSDFGLKKLVEAAYQGFVPKLERLLIACDGISLPKEVLYPGHATTIFNYVFQQEKWLHPEFKILLVGQGRVGKTHLRKRLFSSEPEPLYYEDEEKRTKDFERDQVIVEKKYKSLNHLKGNVWDFGGQDELHSTHRFFLGAHRCFYVLVVDLTKPPTGPKSNKIDYWLRAIGHHGRRKTTNGFETAPIIVITTKWDKVDLAAESSRYHANRKACLQYLNEIEATQKDSWCPQILKRIDGLGWSDDAIRLGTSDSASEREKAQNIKQRHLQALESINDALSEHAADVLEIDIPLDKTFFAVRNFINNRFAEDAEKPLKFFSISDKNWRSDELIELNPSDGEIELSIQMLRNLGLVHWGGDLLDNDGRPNSEISSLVFNPQWVRQPLYELLHAENHHGVVNRETIENKLLERLESKDGKTLYDKLSFTVDDRKKLLTLLCECRIASRAPKAGKESDSVTDLLFPELLPSIPGPQSRWKDYFGELTFRRRLEFSYLPHRIFAEIIAKYRVKCDLKELHLFNNEIEFQLDDDFGQNHVILRAEPSVTNFQKPWIEIGVRGSTSDKRFALYERLFAEIQQIANLDASSSVFRPDSMLDRDEEPRSNGIEISEQRLTTTPTQRFDESTWKGKVLNRIDCDFPAPKTSKQDKKWISAETSIDSERNILGAIPKSLGEQRSAAKRLKTLNGIVADTECLEPADEGSLGRDQARRVWRSRIGPTGKKEFWYFHRKDDMRMVYWQDDSKAAD